MTGAKTKVLFFAQLAESAQRREMTVVHTDTITVRNVADLALIDLPSALKDDLYDGTVMVAVNKKRADWQAPVAPGDEVAFLPPFSGG